MIVYAGGARCEYYDPRWKLLMQHPLPMPRVVLIGRHWWRCCRDSQVNPDYWEANRYDLTGDVRELICDPIRPDVYAMWADPWEWWAR